MAGEVKAGRYEVTREVGRGGMGVVYRARDVRLGRDVALKMIPREVVHNAELRRRLEQEARAASALSHSAVATVYDFVDDGAESFIVYEYVEGATVRQRLAEHRFSTEKILDVGIELAEGLAVAHQRGIVHRDLKPENVMLTPGSGGSGHVKILDFGLAKHCGTAARNDHLVDTGAETASVNTAAGVIVGTVNYMSPEQLEGECADPRSDIYALGLVLYEMATGVNPFVGRTSSATIANILKQDAPPVQMRNPVAPLELDRILRKCLRKRREERYQSASELAVDLSNLRRDSSGAAPSVLTQTVPLEIRRGLARSLFLLIQLGYLVMYGLGFYAFQKSSHPLAAPLGLRLESGLLIGLLVAALAGTPLRLYLLSAVSFDYVDTGRLFRQAFPLVLLFDLAWAAAPFLLYQQLGLAVLLFIPALAYLPFSQRTLAFAAYVASGGRTSGLRDHNPA